MPIEDNASILAGSYSKPVKYNWNPKLNEGEGGLSFTLEENDVTCSATPGGKNDILKVNSGKVNEMVTSSPSFIYLDCGAWVDDADGYGLKRRNFGLVCGPHVYLCSFYRRQNKQQLRGTSKVKSVEDFLDGLAQSGCGVTVDHYARASDKMPLSANTKDDPTLYLFLGDLHLPPISWFVKQLELKAEYEEWRKRRPDWPEDFPPPPLQPQADIFRSAGADLTFFLNGLCSLPSSVKDLLHFIQLGDMFELWLGRTYQFQPGLWEPNWVGNESIGTTAFWAWEVLAQNKDVAKAFEELGKANLKEVKYLWGNHDAYLKDPKVTDRLNQPQRDRFYVGLSEDLYAEHGHRFDSSNYDNVSGFKFTNLKSWVKGPAVVSLLYQMPVLRKAESFARKVTGQMPALDTNLLGATVLYLSIHHDPPESQQSPAIAGHPFSIYVMAHSHVPQLFTFKIAWQFKVEWYTCSQCGYNSPGAELVECPKCKVKGNFKLTSTSTTASAPGP